MSSPGLASSLLRFLMLWMFAFSFGGFVFYAAVVVPIGSDVLSTTTQGFVTRHVTNVINYSVLLTAVALAINAWVRWHHRRTASNRTLLISLALIFSCSAGLFWLHPQLEALLVEADREVLDSARFYFLHRIYLWVSTVQWGASFPAAWVVFVGRPRWQEHVDAMEVD